jgi:hypothetical protein
MLIHGQTYRDLLLSDARTISLTVVDPNGKPIPDVHIDHTGDMRQAFATDAEGKCQLQTRAPALVLRKPGYSDYFIRTAAAGNIRIALKEAEGPQTPPACLANSSCVSIAGWDAEFCFPRVAGMKPKPQGRDIDYGSRAYTVKTLEGSRSIGHGSGPMWTFGTPLDADVWRSVEYEGTTYPDGKLFIVDARGRNAEGKRWRYLGKFGESASYRDADELVARTLDDVLDGMCVRNSSR